MGRRLVVDEEEVRWWKGGKGDATGWTEGEKVEKTKEQLEQGG
jgi:hypothetical protein